ncbi:hypothetical protein PMAYCL1PPCAC_14124, partial [Pristionchus mayeri]
RSIEFLKMHSLAILSLLLSLSFAIARPQAGLHNSIDRLYHVQGQFDGCYRRCDVYIDKSGYGKQDETPSFFQWVEADKTKDIAPAGALKLRAALLTDNTQITINYADEVATDYKRAVLNFQLEDLDKKSSVKSIVIDVFDKICSTNNGEKSCRYVEGMDFARDNEHKISGVPLPTWDDFEFDTETSSGSLRMWMDDEEGNLLMDTRILVVEE